MCYLWIFSVTYIIAGKSHLCGVCYAEEPPPQLPPPRQRKVPPSLSNAATPQDGDHDRTLVVKQVSFVIDVLHT